MYGITSLSDDASKAAALEQIVRNHWHIENKLHYVRDVTLREDACQVCKGAAPQVLATLRNAIIHLLADVDARSVPEAIEYLQIHPNVAQKLIGIPQRE